MQEQLSFRDAHFQPEKAKSREGDLCYNPHCKRPIRWRAKTFDRRLAGLLAEILCYTAGEYVAFESKDVFKNDHLKLCDFNKLHYWELIKQVRPAGWWKVTKRGTDFMRGEIQIPYRLWWFNGEVKDQSEEMTSIGSLELRWQRKRLDWSMDYRAIVQSIQLEKV